MKPPGTEVTKESPLFSVIGFPWRFYIIFSVSVLSTGLVNEIDSTTWGGWVNTGSGFAGLTIPFDSCLAIGAVNESVFWMLSGWVACGWTVIDTGLFAFWTFYCLLTYETWMGLCATGASTGLLTSATGAGLWKATGAGAGLATSTDLTSLWDI